MLNSLMWNPTNTFIPEWCRFAYHDLAIRREFNGRIWSGVWVGGRQQLNKQPLPCTSGVGLRGHVQAGHTYFFGSGRGAHISDFGYSVQP